MVTLVAVQISQISECLQLAGSFFEEPCLTPVQGGAGLLDQDTGV